MLNLFNFHSIALQGSGGEVKLKHRSNMSTFFILSTCCCVVGEAGQNQTWLNNAQHINFVHILNLLLCRGRGCKFKTKLNMSVFFILFNFERIALWARGIWKILATKYLWGRWRGRFNITQTDSFHIQNALSTLIIFFAICFVRECVNFQNWFNMTTLFV